MPGNDARRLDNGYCDTEMGAERSECSGCLVIECVGWAMGTMGVLCGGAGAWRLGA